MLGNGPLMLGNGLHMLGVGPNVLANGPPVGIMSFEIMSHSWLCCSRLCCIWGYVARDYVA